MNTYDLKQAAAIAHVHPHTLRKMAVRREVPATKIGRSWIFPVHLFDAWIEAKCLSKDAPTPPTATAKAKPRSLAERLAERRKLLIETKAANTKAK